MNKLPNECHYIIASYVPIRDQIALSWTCKEHQKRLQRCIWESFKLQVDVYLPPLLFQSTGCILYGSFVLELIFEDDFEAMGIDLLCHINDMSLLKSILEDAGWEMNGLNASHPKQDINIHVEVISTTNIRLEGPNCTSNWYNGAQLYIDQPVNTLGLTEKGKIMVMNDYQLAHVFNGQENCNCHDLVKRYLERGYMLKHDNSNRFTKKPNDCEVLHVLLFGF